MLLPKLFAICMAGQTDVCFLVNIPSDDGNRPWLRFNSIHRLAALLFMTLAHFTFDPKQKRLHIDMEVERLDASVAVRFRDELVTRWPEQPPASVDVDLRTVAFIDSSGIGSLIAVSKKLGRQGALVALHNVHPQVRSVIELLRLQSLFRVI